MPREFNYSIYGSRRVGASSCRSWLTEHYGEVQRFLDEVYKEDDHDQVLSWFFDNPKMAKSWVSDFFIMDKEKLSYILKQFTRKGEKSKIMFIIGARGSGKTATAFWLAENLKNDVNVYYVGAPEDMVLPEWIKTARTVEDVPNNTLVIIDESGLQFNAREFWKEGAKVLTKQMATARHKKKSLIFITQHQKLSDINISRLADIVTLKSGAVWMDLDKKRTFVSDLINNMRPRNKKQTLFYYPENNKISLVERQPLPKCWTKEISKGWKDTKFKEKEVQKQTKTYEEEDTLP